MHYASWKLEGHQDTLDIPHNKEQLMDNVEQMSARNIPDLSRPNHVTNMLVEVEVCWVCLPGNETERQVSHLQVRSYQDCISKCIS